MKVLVVVVLLSVAVSLAKPPLAKWKEFKVKYNKTYQTADEEGMRYQVFLANLARADKLQALSPAARFGVTKFSDLTPAEFKNKYLMNVTFDKNNLPKAPVWTPPQNLQQFPSYFDWNDKGVVTAVKNQEQCGSCWAFSATETIESVNAIAGNGLDTLSEQQIVDCDTGDDGCNGGFPYGAYTYIISAGGQDSESSYPYAGEQGSCEVNSNFEASISNWQWVTQSEDENAMQQYLYSYSPLSICVDAEIWQSYEGGVITSGTCGTSIDHCVQLTGWQQQQGYNVWNVRNSWGADWGENGYIWVQMGSDVCGIAQVVTVPCVGSTC